MSLVYIMPLGAVDPGILKIMQRAIATAFGLETTIGRERRDIAYAFDATRNQYHVSKLLVDLIQHPPPDALRVVGIAEVDIFLPIFTFLFGEAQLGGIGAILSTHRLHSDFYGVPHDPALFAERVAKETVHELGHTFGLIHCLAPVCVMRSSTYVEDIDQKSVEFCSGCRRKLDTNLPQKKSLFGL